MSPLASTLVATLGATVFVMLLLWGLALFRRDVSLVDIYWGIGFLLVTALAVAMNRPAPPRGAVVLLLISLWGIRLAAYLLWRKWGEEEDRRYQAMRDHHGPRFRWISLFTVFLLQGFLLWLISLPLQVVATPHSAAFPGVIDVVGLVAWLAGFVFECVGDAQLAVFMTDPANKGRVLDRGLWRLTRHPNYFGEFLMWWGLYALSLPAGGAWTIVSPVVMTVLLLRVSGVSLLESTIGDRRPEYAEYRRRTNAFFPGRPKPSSDAG